MEVVLVLLCKIVLKFCKIVLKFCKVILGVKRNCTSLAVLGDLGEIPVTMNMLTRIELTGIDWRQWMTVAYS